MNNKVIELAKKLEKISNEKRLYNSIKDIEKIIENKKREVCLKL